MKKLIIYILLITNFVVLIYLWYQFSGSFLQTSSLGNSLIGLGRLSGLLATNLILLQLILIGRVKWVESVFGLDKLANLHRWNGYLILFFIVLHPVLLVQGYASLNQTTYLGQYVDFLTQWEDILKAFLGFLILILTIGLSITIVRRKLKYESWYYVHIFNYLAIALIFGHQIHYGASAQSDTFKIYWISLYAIALTNLIWFRFIRPLIKFNKHRFEVSKVEQLNNATSIFITGRNLSKFTIEPGQFMIFRFLQKGFWVQAHPFSLSKAPDNNSIRLTAKALGDYTSRLNQIKLGTKVIIDGPHGVFTAKRANSHKLLFIAGGIGITPIRSILEQLNTSDKNSLLLYANKTESDIIFKDELEKLSSQNQNLKVIHLLSNEDKPGFIHGILTKELIKNLVPDLLNRDIYLCGPPSMMKSVRQALAELGVSKQKIYFEKFAL